jgi:hypothetical protein
MVGVRGDNERVVYLNGYVCPRCVLGGSEQIAVELRNRAEDSRRAAEQLERWASEPFDVPAEATAVIRSADPLWQTAGKPPGSDKVQ